jgi:hypothetical protein
VKKADATLEPLDQDGVTLHWDALCEVVRESIGAGQETRVMESIRGGQTAAMAIWISGDDGQRVAAWLVVRPFIDMGGRPGLCLQGLHGRGVTMRQWRAAFEQLRAVAKTAGYMRIVAETDVARVLEIADALGFARKSLLISEV